jgi:hypothetical protein
LTLVASKIPGAIQAMRCGMPFCDAGNRRAGSSASGSALQ